jgi:hypothetical protein
MMGSSSDVTLRPYEHWPGAICSAVTICVALALTPTTYLLAEETGTFVVPSTH